MEQVIVKTLEETRDGDTQLQPRPVDVQGEPIDALHLQHHMVGEQSESTSGRHCWMSVWQDIAQVPMTPISNILALRVSWQRLLQLVGSPEELVRMVGQWTCVRHVAAGGANALEGQESFIFAAMILSWQREWEQRAGRVTTILKSRSEECPACLIIRG